MKVLVTGEVKTVPNRRDPVKPYSFSVVWVHLPNQPYPQKTEVFGIIGLPAGEYDVPLSVYLDRNQRLAVSLEFDKAKAVDK